MRTPVYAFSMRRVGCLLAIIVAAGLALGGYGVAGESEYLHVRMQSELLSKFWGQPVTIDANILLPDSYYKEPSRRYPVMYFVQGFDGYGDPNTAETLAWQTPMRDMHEEFILIFLDGMF